MRTPRIRTGVLASISALTIPLALMVPPAQAAVASPPTGDHLILVFPERDFVSVEGWTETNLTVEVLRNGFVVGSATGLNPVNGLVEINHAGPPCWDTVTPDIRAGDVVQVLTAPDTGESTLTYDVRVTDPAAATGPDTVTVHGTAGTPAAPLPLADLQTRLISPGNLFDANGRRDVRAHGDGSAGEGSLVYDAPGSNAWTATFTGLSTADVSRAVNAESRIMRLGGLNEATIFEFGAFGGPSPGCAAPAATGPSVPDLAAASDSGASATDNITKNTSVTFGGSVGLPDTTDVELFIDGTPSGFVTPSGGTYSFTKSLSPGTHLVTASESGPTSPQPVMSAAALSVEVDTSVPGAPQVTATDPVSPNPSLTPNVRGTAGAGEDTSKVSIFDNATCAGTALGSGTGLVFGDTGIATTVTAGSTSLFHAQTTDLAGNLSGCSTTSAEYIQDNVAPPMPTLEAGSTSGVVNSNVATFVFSDEPGVTFKCELDGGTPEICESPVTYPSLSEGPHVFSVTATDPAAHVSEPLVVNWTVDTIAPDAPTMGRAPNGFVSSTQATFSFSHSEADVDFLCALDDALPQPCSSPKTWTGLSQGRHTASIMARDAAGQLSEARDARWTVDTNGPKVVDRDPGKNATNVSPAKHLKVTLSEEVTGATTRTVKLFAEGSPKATPVVVSYNPRKNIITIVPRSRLRSGTRYSIELLGGGIKDLAKNQLSPTLWRFTTGS